MLREASEGAWALHFQRILQEDEHYEDVQESLKRKRDEEDEKDNQKEETGGQPPAEKKPKLEDPKA